MPLATDRIVIDGAPNFRDLGGLPVAGGSVRPGLVYRSEGLERLTDEGVAALGALGVKLVCDLRTATERERHPSRWPEDAVPELLAVDGGVDLRTLHGHRLRTLFDDESGDSAREFMLDMYAAMPEIYGPALGHLAERLADRDEHPAVVHCAAGKDRTGFVCTMLLVALGAEQDVIQREYLLSDHFFGLDRLARVIAAQAGSEPPLGVVEGFRSDVAYLDAAQAAIVERHGSSEAYLDSVGIDAARRAKLRALMVVPD